MYHLETAPWWKEGERERWREGTLGGIGGGMLMKGVVVPVVPVVVVVAAAVFAVVVVVLLDEFAGDIAVVVVVHSKWRRSCSAAKDNRLPLVELDQL